MTKYHWTADVSATWSTPGAWNPVGTPGAGDDAILGGAGAYTVTIGASDPPVVVNTITLDDAGATLAIDGTLTLAGTQRVLLETAGNLVVSGTIVGGTIDAGDGTLLASGGTLDGVTYQGVLALAGGTDESLFIANGVTLRDAAGTGPGSIDITAASGASAGVSMVGGGSLDNATLTFGGGTADWLSTGTGVDSGHTLTLGAGFTIDVTAGTTYLGQAGVVGINDAGDNLDNAGTITVAAGALIVVYGTFENTGSIGITGGTLTVLAPVTTAQLGRVTAIGGALEVAFLTNTGATLNVGAGGVAGTIALNDGDTITGGTIVAADDMLLANGGTLAGVTYQGTLALTGGGDDSLFVTNGLTLRDAAGTAPGAIDITSGGDSAGAGISVVGSGSLDNATLRFGAGSNDWLTTGSLAGADSGHTLTLGGGFTIDVTGGTNVLGQSGATGIIDSGDALDNAGTIAVDAGSLAIVYGTFDNAGTVAITGGTLTVRTPVTTAQLGRVTAIGAALEVTDLNNSGATLAVGAGGTAGTIALNSGDTITGGTLAATADTLLANEGTLSGVTYQGALAIGAQQVLYITNGLTLLDAAGKAPGTIDFTGPYYAGMSVLDSATLDHAVLNFGTGFEMSLTTGAGNDSGQTLTLGGGFTVDVAGGTDYLGQGFEYFANDSGDTLTNAGTVNVASGFLSLDYGTFTNTGAVAISGGSFTANADVTNDGTMRLSGGGTLEFGDAPSGGGVIAFAGPGILQIDAALSGIATFGNVLTGLAAGDKIDLAGLAYVSGATARLETGGVIAAAAAAGRAQAVPSVGTIVLVDGATTEDFLLDAPGNVLFTVGADGGGTGTLITAQAACYARGTHIRTPRGDVPIEHLVIGDTLLTASGLARKIRWIGRRSYAGRFVARNKDILPVLIRAGALAEGLPCRDLTVSPLHAIYLDGVLVPAIRLVNGVSITQAERIDAIEYFHVELDTHDVILAEGAPSESFVDDDSRMMFQNAHEFFRLYPVARSMPARYCAPRVTEGFALAAIRARLDIRAGLRAPGPCLPLRGFVDRVGAVLIEGWAQNPARPEVPVCLDVLVDGMVVAQALANRFRADLLAARIGSGCHGFSVRLTVPLAADQRARVAVRRSSDFSVLPRSVPAASERVALARAG